MNNVGTAYLLWLGCLFQVHGLHRFYNGKVVTGLLWMCTFGLFGLGQLLDLMLIPGMVDEHNTQWRSRHPSLSPHDAAFQPTVQRVLVTPPPVEPPRLQRNELVVKLVKAAERRGGRLSVTQAVLETETEFETVERALQSLVKTGYVDVYNVVSRCLLA